MSTISRPTFYDDQVLTAEELNALTGYVDHQTERLRIICVTATLVSWAAALVAIFAIWTRKRRCLPSD